MMNGFTCLSGVTAALACHARNTQLLAVQKGGEYVLGEERLLFDPRRTILTLLGLVRKRAFDFWSSSSS